jgi:hypothetical protein
MQQQIPPPFDYAQDRNDYNVTSNDNNNDNNNDKYGVSPLRDGR